MTEINLAQELVQASALLSSPDVALQLRKVGRATFALCWQEGQTLAFAFSSSALVHFLDQSLVAEINDVSLIRCETFAGCPSERSLVLQLRLSSGALVTLNQADELYIAEPYVACEQVGTLTSPNQRWGLFGVDYLGRMLLTERMVTYVEGVGDEHLSHLLYTLWRDFELQVKCSATRLGRITVEGELMVFSVRPFCDGQFIFDYV